MQGHIQPAGGRIDSGRLSPASGICGYFPADNIEKKITMYDHNVINLHGRTGYPCRKKTDNKKHCIAEFRTGYV